MSTDEKAFRRATRETRERLLTASVEELLAIRREVYDAADGCEWVLLRDVYAYAIVRFLGMFGFSVFGGFVAAHLSGNTWNDIDLLVPSDAPLEYDHVVRVVAFLRLAFGLKPMQVVLEELPDRKYSRRFRVTITDEGVRYVVEMDVVSDAVYRSFAWCPVSLGKCLTMQDGAVSIRRIPKASMALLSWELADIVRLLRTGADVGLSLAESADNAEYGRYFWERIESMRASGYAVDTFLGTPPPQPA